MNLTDTISLVQDHHGWWLYDTTRGMNLAMRAASRDAAFIEALEYYQERTQELEARLKCCKAKIEACLTIMNPDIEEDQC